MRFKNLRAGGIVAFLLSIGALTYGASELAFHHHLHVIYLFLAVLGFVGMLLFEKSLPPES